MPSCAGLHGTRALRRLLVSECCPNAACRHGTASLCRPLVRTFSVVPERGTNAIHTHKEARASESGALDRASDSEGTRRAESQAVESQ